jgi:hypothetical protein
MLGGLPETPHGLRTHQHSFAEPHPTHLPPGPGRRGRAAVALGRRRSGGARPGRRHDHEPRAAQRHRHAQRQLRRLPRARGGGRQPDPRPPRRPDQHRAHRPDRPLPAVGRWREDRLDRPLGRERAACVCASTSRAATTSGRRSPSPRRTSTCPRSGRPSPSSACRSDGKVLLDDGFGHGDQDRHRTGLVAARRGARFKAAAKARCAARCSRRPAACTRSW